MDKPSTSATEDATLCKLCNVESRKYTCPKCGIGYCSVDCYKSEEHLDCSENFYKQCVEEELKLQESDPESQQRMIDILKRMQDDSDNDILNDILEDNSDERISDLDSDDEADCTDLQQKLENVDINDANKVWSLLSDYQKQEFEALVKSGKVEKLIPQWIPWWTYGTEKKLIEDLDTDQRSGDYLKECPALIDVPEFNELSKASPQVCFNVQNVIYAYAYIALYFNGDYLNCAIDATNIFLSICDNMRENIVFKDSVEAQESVVKKIINYNFVPEDKQILSAFEEGGDSILRGPAERTDNLYASAALSELHRLLTKAKKEITQKKDPSTKSDFDKRFNQSRNLDLDNIVFTKKTLLLCLKKLEYYLSWIKARGHISTN